MYGLIVERLFLARWRKGAKSVEFHRSDIEAAAAELGVKLPKNLGDVIYSFRFRRALPETVRASAAPGYEWVIELSGASTYRFTLAKINRLVPQASLAPIDIPDATPEIVLRYAQGDEQALLAQLRYNRLIDVFLGIATYSLQNHLRTSIRVDRGRTQIEIDELYVGVIEPASTNLNQAA
jgi:DNA-binding CsgD family transcriptional regulator